MEKSKLHYELLPHQIIAVERIKRDGSLLLADEAGAMKTGSAIMATKDQKKILVLTLAGLKHQFFDELSIWLPEIKAIVINGAPQQRESLWKSDFQYYIANYELLLKDLHWMAQWDWDYIISDECTRLSNIRNKQYRALRQLRPRHRLAMTGTPIQNKPDDIFGILDWKTPNSLGNYWKFINSFVVKNDKNWIIGYKNQEQLAALIAPHMLRRLKSEILDLPKLIISDVAVELSPKERKLYRQIKNDLLSDIEKSEINKVVRFSSLQLAIVKFGKLCEVCDSLELLGESKESSKLTALRDLLSTLSDSNIVIFTRFSRMADILERELNCLKITGAVQTAERSEIINTFNNTTGAILVGTRAISFGLNLQKASVIINYDQSLSLAEHEQKISRAYRGGQTKNVLVYNLLCEKSIDKTIAKRLSEKQDMNALLLSDIKALISEEPF